MSNTKTIKAAELDEAFDRGDDMRQYFDFSKPRIVKPAKTKTRKVNLTIPEWIIEDLDEEADELAISRNSVVNIWLAEHVRNRRNERALTHA